MFFYWNDWNRAHATSHGVSCEEAEFVVRHATPPFPEDAGQGKYRVWGRTDAGRIVQVIFVFTSPEQMDYEQMTLKDILSMESSEGPFVYIIHARDLVPLEKRRLNRRST